MCNGRISEEIKGVLWVCNGRPFKTCFGMSYLDDSFFYTHQYALTVNCSDISKLCKALLGIFIKTNIISYFVSFPLFSNIVVKYMNRLELFVDQFISINDTLCVF